MGIGDTLSLQAGASRFHVGLRTPTRLAAPCSDPPPLPPPYPESHLLPCFPALPDLLEGGSSQGKGVGTVELVQEEFHPQHPGKAGPQAWTQEVPPQPLESIPERHPDFLQPTGLISPSRWDRKPLPMARSLRPSGHTTGLMEGPTSLRDSASTQPAQWEGMRRGNVPWGGQGPARVPWGY